MNLLNIVTQSSLTQVTSHPAAEQIVKHDPYGVLLAMISISVVMTVLAFIYISFKLISRLIQRGSQALSKKAEYPVKVNENMTSGEISAAIAYALHLYNQQLASEEATELTIKRITHRYSPWSSKIHTLQRYPGQNN